MQPAVLLCLLGAVVAAVSSVPVNSGNHNEELVTRCIIEVLSNALSKYTSPPITPECRQILKKSGTEVKDVEKNGNENTRFEVRLLRDQAGASEAHSPSDREEGEEDPQDPTRAGTEGGRHIHGEASEPQGHLYASDSQVTKEADTHQFEKSLGENREGEGGKYQKREHKDGGSEEKHLEEPEETPNAFSNKRNEATDKKKEELMSGYDKHSARSSEEMTHSRERSSQESGEESTSQQKHPQESKTQSQSQEESEESEEEDSPEVDKRLMRPRHHHGRSRPERNPSSEDRGLYHEQSEESNMDLASLGDMRGRDPTNYRAPEEEPEYGGEIKNYLAVQPTNDLEGEQSRGRGSEEYRALRIPGKESQEEDKRNRLSSEVDNMEHGYSEENEEESSEGSHQHRARGGELGVNNKDEKRFLGGVYHHVQETQMDKARRYPLSKWNEQDRNFLNYGEERDEEGAQGKWQQQQEYLQGSKENREEARFHGKQYAPYQITEKRKRLGELLNSYYELPQWKSSHFERKSNTDDNYLEGEEENGLNLNEKNFFPVYNYEWLEKKPSDEDVNWGYEKRNLAPKLDLKRQYDRVAELDQLLHYRKKSAEFPDFYDPEEQMIPRNAAENERDRIHQRVLTEEEEKELENLAAMDLELQKIAEKFSGNRGG